MAGFSPSTLGASGKKLKGIATGYERYEQINDTTVKVYFKNGDSVTLKFPEPTVSETTIKAKVDEWLKSNIKLEGIATVEDVDAVKEEIKATSDELTKEINKIKETSGVDMSNYYTKEEVSSLVSINSHSYEDDGFMYICHMGDYSKYHQNSLEAIQSALEQGFKWFELDLRVSKDGVYYLLHDNNYTLYDKNGNSKSVGISGATSNDVKGLYWDSACTSTFTSLEQALILLKKYRAKLVLDKKSGNNADIMKVVARHGMTKNVMLSYGSVSQIISEKALLQKYPETPYRFYPASLGEYDTYFNNVVGVISNTGYMDIYIGTPSKLNNGFPQALRYGLPIIFSGTYSIPNSWDTSHIFGNPIWANLGAGVMFEQNVSLAEMKSTMESLGTKTSNLTVSNTSLSVDVGGTVELIGTSDNSNIEGTVFAYSENPAIANLSYGSDLKYTNNHTFSISGVAKGNTNIYVFTNTDFITVPIIVGGENTGNNDTVTLQSISATKTKTTYNVGDTVDTSDIVVSGKYSDNTTKVINGATFSTVDTSTSGTKTLTVSYGGKTTTITIIINAIIEDDNDNNNNDGVLDSGTIGIRAYSVKTGSNSLTVTTATSKHHRFVVFKGTSPKCSLSVPTSSSNFNVSANECIYIPSGAKKLTIKGLPDYFRLSPSMGTSFSDASTWIEDFGAISIDASTYEVTMDVTNYNGYYVVFIGSYYTDNTKSIDLTLDWNNITYTIE